MDHERLDVYHLIRQYNRVLNRMLKRLDTSGWSRHVDQLRRAGASMSLNLAEGCGEFALPERARFLRMAKRSATESASALDYFVDVEIAVEEDIQEPKDLLRRIISMLVPLIRRNAPDRDVAARSADRVRVQAR